MSASDNFWRMVSRPEAHQFFKDEVDMFASHSILEKTRYRLDPESERQMNVCLRELRSIAAASKLVARSEPKAPTCNVVQLHG